MPSSEVMHKFGAGTLKSGSGEPVKNQKQAVAIMYSEKRKEAAHGGTYPEKHAEGGAVKGYMGRETKFAEGGPVTARSGDWKKTVPNRGFLDQPDRFRGEDEPGAKKNARNPDPTLDVWGKGSSKANPAASDKSEKPIKPRG